MSVWLTSLLQLITPGVLFYLFLGVLIGAIIGSLPGLSATMGIAILTPVTFWFDPAEGFAMLIGVWNSAIFAGGISAILINTPGTPASLMQSFDGYALYKQGKGGLALGCNIVYSAFGGLVSILAFSIFAFPIARFTVKFGPTEYCALALFGLSMMVTVSGGNVIKGLAMGFAGLLFATIGLDPILAVKRYTFDLTELVGGISYIPIMIGMFGIGEVLIQIYNRKHTADSEEEKQKRKNLSLGRVLPTWRQVKSLIKPTCLSSVIATIVGAVPAAGGDIATIIAWGQGKKMSKHPEEYGKGSLEGLAIASSANNGVIGGALTTMLTLGIPGDTVTAILIGSLTMYGMQPGIKMFTENVDFVYKIIFLSVFAIVGFVIVGLLTVKVTAKMLNIKQERIWALVCIFCVIGSYSLSNNFFDVIIMFAGGILGFFAKRHDYPVGPFILGMILSSMIESNLRRALIISHGSFSIFFTRPITLVILALTIMTFFWPSLRAAIKRKMKS